MAAPRELEQDAIGVEIFTNALADAEVVQKLLEEQPCTLARAYEIAHRSRPPIQPSIAQVLQGIGHEGLAVLGEVTLPVQVGNRVNSVNFIMADTAESTEVILGHPFLHQACAHLDYGCQEITLFGEKATCRPCTLRVVLACPRTTVVKLAHLLQSYGDVFSTGPTDLGRTSLVQHDILTTPVPPVKQPPCRMARDKQTAADQQVQQSLETGVAQPSNSSWAAPIVMIQKVMEWPTPQNVSEVRQFVGLAAYYRRFVENFATIAKPLHELTQKYAHFNWTDECQKAFEELKSRLTSAPVLGYPLDSGELFLNTDASDWGIGAVLSQVQGGKERVLAYGSRRLSATEQNCTTR
ncbi:hypothetical protein SKAU_G00278710 [Synaphobranchus kaupii]|uniref:Reverse transcriptase/retrotransposon-derived protein RNase H-like domain-containing protein n=1 Tax=Synaphobranchus kaupii TaxID=118154 RepID=A0A9Q1EWQ4_SYNKA|nr:hypothetical protein SKAU_G00278710 [Synaphobranchus kaupii]